MNSVTTHAVAGAASTVTVAALFPDVDLWSLMAAFVGGLLFIINEQELSLWKRVIYLPIATFIGYTGAEELLVRFSVHSRPLAACIGGAIAITVILRIISLAETWSFGRKDGG